MKGGTPVLHDTILQQIENGSESKVKPELKPLYQSIELATTWMQNHAANMTNTGAKS